MGSMDILDVLIAGAGPVGLALALDLERLGVRSAIVEHSSSTETELLARASVMNERSMEFMRLLGMSDEKKPPASRTTYPATPSFAFRSASSWTRLLVNGRGSHLRRVG